MFFPLEPAFFFQAKQISDFFLSLYMKNLIFFKLCLKFLVENCRVRLFIFCIFRDNIFFSLNVAKI